MLFILFLEWDTDVIEESFCFFFRFGGGDKSDCETEDVFELLVSRFWEDCVFLDTKCEITNIVESLGVKSAEVLCSRKCNVDKLIDKRIHSLATQRYHLANDFTFTELE